MFKYIIILFLAACAPAEGRHGSDGKDGKDGRDGMPGLTVPVAPPLNATPAPSPTPTPDTTEEPEQDTQVIPITAKKKKVTLIKCDGYAVLNSQGKYLFCVDIISEDRR